MVNMRNVENVYREIVSVMLGCTLNASAQDNLAVRLETKAFYLIILIKVIVFR